MTDSRPEGGEREPWSPADQPAGVGSRREQRERALTLLYEAEAKGVTPAAVLDQLPVRPEQFTAELVVGVSDHIGDLDDLIRRFAKGWTLERMPVIDRNLLRMAAFELGHRPDVPTGAVISEAVELAKTYSTDESGKFVNGMLGRIADELRGKGSGRSGGSRGRGGAGGSGAGHPPA